MCGLSILRFQYLNYFIILRSEYDHVLANINKFSSIFTVVFITCTFNIIPCSSAGSTFCILGCLPCITEVISIFTYGYKRPPCCVILNPRPSHSISRAAWIILFISYEKSIRVVLPVCHKIKGYIFSNGEDVIHIHRAVTYCNRKLISINCTRYTQEVRTIGSC